MRDIGEHGCWREFASAANALSAVHRDSSQPSAFDELYSLPFIQTFKPSSNVLWIHGKAAKKKSPKRRWYACVSCVACAFYFFIYFYNNVLGCPLLMQHTCRGDLCAQQIAIGYAYIHSECGVSTLPHAHVTGQRREEMRMNNREASTNIWFLEYGKHMLTDRRHIQRNRLHGWSQWVAHRNWNERITLICIISTRVDNRAATRQQPNTPECHPVVNFMTESHRYTLRTQARLFCLLHCKLCSSN